MSIDMIRLKTRVPIGDFQCFHDNYAYEPRFYVYYSGNIKDYRYNYKIDCGNTSIYLGFFHNSENVRDLKHFTVCEFNPNKIDFSDSIFQDIMLRFFSGEYQIVSFDFAVDLDVDINNLFFDRKGRHVKIFDYGGSNKTIYIGERGNRLKIYNKAIEQGLQGQIWTRVEYSIRSEISNRHVRFFYPDLDSFPDIYVVEQLPIIDDLTLRAVMYAVMNGYPLSDLSRKYKFKIKNLMSSLSRIEIKSEDINRYLTNLISSFSSIISQL